MTHTCYILNIEVGEGEERRKAQSADEMITHFVDNTHHTERHSTQSTRLGLNTHSEASTHCKMDVRKGMRKKNYANNDVKATSYTPPLSDVYCCRNHKFR